MPDTVNVNESWASSPGVRRGMQANRGRDTQPEMAVRRAAHAAGLRFRVDYRPIPNLNRRADLVFTRAKVAVFVDGCFWHGCPTHHTVAKANAGFWAQKVTRNRERDAETSRLLRDVGWTVIRAWEHEPTDDVVARILASVRRA
ncbi:very short patch repair endonuclease [Nocardioides dongkuii]|uniref:very short patch repair endonuclease n=1 Tax=Nocardioides dongkuii TaxID=2760089 RepID=UPI001D0C56BF|nr:very short patch repair endonuclease [Nocardioides dongkuii]